jgi:hypothetical protein
MSSSRELYGNMHPLPLRDLLTSAEGVNKPQLPMNWNRDVPEQIWRNKHPGLGDLKS